MHARILLCAGIVQPDAVHRRDVPAGLLLRCRQRRRLAVRARNVWWERRYHGAWLQRRLSGGILLRRRCDVAEGVQRVQLPDGELLPTGERGVVVVPRWRLRWQRRVDGAAVQRPVRTVLFLPAWEYLPDTGFAGRMPHRAVLHERRGRGAAMHRGVLRKRAWAVVCHMLGVVLADRAKTVFACNAHLSLS